MGERLETNKMGPVRLSEHVVRGCGFFLNVFGEELVCWVVYLKETKRTPPERLSA